jgi:hypothetical protein
MNEPYRMGCDELADVAAELALGVLTGRERAEALAHLDQCPACRENVRQLTTTGEELLELLPAIEPPPGFETRVMDRLGLTTPAPVPIPDHGSARRPRASRRWSTRPAGRTRRLLSAAAVAAAIAVAVLGGWGLHAATTAPAASPLSSAALLSATSQRTGTVFLYTGSPRWLYMSVDLASGNGTVICQLISRDGQVTTIGSFRLTRGYGSWSSPEPGTAGTPAAARLISPDGTVLATATFPGD